MTLPFSARTVLVVLHFSRAAANSVRITDPSGRKIPFPLSLLKKLGGFEVEILRHGCALKDGWREMVTYRIVAWRDNLVAEYERNAVDGMGWRESVARSSLTRGVSPFLPYQFWWKRLWSEFGHFVVRWRKFTRFGQLVIEWKRKSQTEQRCPDGRLNMGKSLRLWIYGNSCPVKSKLGKLWSPREEAHRFLMFSFRYEITGTQVPWAATSYRSHKRPCLLYVFISELGSFVMPDLTGASNGSKNKKLSQ